MITQPASTSASNSPRAGLSRQWDDRDVFTIKEAAAILRISSWTAYGMAQKGDLPTISFGKRKIVPRPALEKLLGYR